MENIKNLCKIIKVADIPLMTEAGVVPYQEDDMINGHLRVYIKSALDEAKKIYFPYSTVRAYYLNHKNLEEERFTVSWDDETYILVGPEDNPTKLLSVRCLDSAVTDM